MQNYCLPYLKTKGYNTTVIKKGCLGFTKPIKNGPNAFGFYYYYYYYYWVSAYFDMSPSCIY